MPITCSSEPFEILNADGMPKFGGIVIAAHLNTLQAFLIDKAWRDPKGQPGWSLR